MTATYKPAIKASDDPAFDPASGLFRPSAGGAPPLDIDSIYGLSDIGDYFISGTNQYTDAGTTPATSPGDLVYRFLGNRTTGGKLALDQATAGRRPELATDGTYGTVTKYVASTIKSNEKTIYNKHLRVSGIRFRVDNDGSTSTGSGFITLGDNYTPINDGFGVAANGDLIIEGGGVRSPIGGTYDIDGDTGWHTAVMTFDGATMSLYFDDMSTPLATISTTQCYAGTIYMGHQVGHTVYVYKSMVHGTAGIATPAEIASWLEA